VNLSLFENAAALRGLQEYQDIIANNIAASHVAGFKAGAVGFEAVEGGEIARSTHDRLKNELPGSFPLIRSEIDYAAGELRQTGNEMDMALHGDGFFALMSTNGDTVYTRDGQFYVNAEGVVVNVMGHEFANDGGSSIRVNEAGSPLTIDKEGQIFQNGELIDTIGVFTFEDMNADLRKVGGGFMTRRPEAVPVEAEPGEFQVMQGFLENSNVSAIREMINLIEVGRAHEANQKMIQAYDQNIGRAIGTLGHTS
jgi:flagellar basal-body rod protein FlgF